MIGFLKGTVKIFTRSGLVIETPSGVGYEIEAPLSGASVIGSEIELWIHTHVRENELKLFGFETLKQKSLFEKLLTVSGVGPKTAHLVVSNLDINDIYNAILLGEVKTLTKVSGVGKKVAERIILELKEKISENDIMLQDIKSSDGSAGNFVSENQQNVREVFEALTSLGYTTESIRNALKDEDTTLSSNELIKICLKKIKN